MSRKHCKSRVVFVVYYSQKYAAAVPVKGGGMQEEGNRDTTTDNRDGKVFTTSSLMVGQGQYSVEGRKRITVNLTFFIYILPSPFFVSSLISVDHFCSRPRAGGGCAI